MSSNDNNIFERFSFRANDTKASIQSPLFSGLKKKETTEFQPTPHIDIDTKKTDCNQSHDSETENVSKTDHNIEPENDSKTCNKYETGRFVLPRGYNKQILEMFAFKPKV